MSLDTQHFASQRFSKKALKVFGKSIEKGLPERLKHAESVLIPLMEQVCRKEKPATWVEALERFTDLEEEVMQNNPTFRAVIPVALDRPGAKALDLIGSGVGRHGGMFGVADCSAYY